jgi:hypothetical protein
MAIILTHCVTEEDLEQLAMLSEPKDVDTESVVKKP